MSDRRAGWLLIIVSGALAIFLSSLVRDQVMARGVLENAASAGEALLVLLLAAAPAILMIVALDVIAFFVCKDIGVRIVASAVAVLTIVGMLVAGGIGAQAADPPASAYWAAGGSEPGPFDCEALNSNTSAEIQAALDEIEHPWPVDIYFAADDSCAAMLRGIPTDQVIADYSSRLEKAGWAIDTQREDWLSATRDGYIVVVNSCYADETESLVGIYPRFEVDASCEPPSP